LRPYHTTLGPAAGPTCSKILASHRHWEPDISHRTCSPRTSSPANRNVRGNVHRGIFRKKMYGGIMSRGNVLHRNHQWTNS